MDVSKNLACVVILYNPSDDFFKNIFSYSHLFKKVVIIDNSEEKLKDINKIFRSFLNVESFQDGENKGIGSRLNFAISSILNENYDWLLTMDQDSYFTIPNIKFYIKIIESLEENNKIAQIGIEYFDTEKMPDDNTQLHEVTHVITSGTFINLKAIPEIGLFREDLFIDEVDTEFSYRALQRGWKNFICKGLYMVHHLGKKVTSYSIKSFKKSERSLHTPLRIYYITRNYLFIKNKYRKLLPSTFKQRNKILLNTFKNNLLYNKEKFKIIKMIIKGYIDYKKNKLGKITK